MRSNDSFKTETIITEQFGFYDTELIDFEREFAKDLINQIVMH